MASHDTAPQSAKQLDLPRETVELDYDIKHEPNLEPAIYLSVSDADTLSTGMASLKKAFAEQQVLIRTIVDLQAAMQPRSDAAATSALVLRPQSPLVVGVPIVQPATTDPVAAAAASLHKLFPRIDKADLARIISHDIQPLELHKLDSRINLYGASGALSVDAAGALYVADARTSYAHYTTLASVLVPLCEYAQILGRHYGSDLAGHASGTGIGTTIMCAFASYTARLVKFADEYKWEAVLAYHVAFHECRLAEMARGSFDGWFQFDNDLYCSLLMPQRKRQQGSGKRGGGKRQ